MPNNFVQQFLTSFEISLFLVGIGLVCLLAFNVRFRTRWWSANHLPAWPLAPAEFALYLLLFFGGSALLTSTLQFTVGKFMAKAADRSGLEVIVYGIGLDGGALLGWMLFPFLRRAWYSDYGVAPAETPAPPALPWSKALLYGAGTVVMAMPLIYALTYGWEFILTQLGLPDEPQDSIAIFANTKSRLIIAGMLVVACVLAPIMEELLVRGGIYRFCRQHLGRGAALLISGVVFGVLHFNLRGLVPLSAFGMVLAVAYETTGSIRVPIVAHAFFNLNTILFILSGMQQ